jgi:NodT family efflux transporter outer membrane factor (OMF) lipoprotein
MMSGERGTGFTQTARRGGAALGLILASCLFLSACRSGQAPPPVSTAEIVDTMITTPIPERFYGDTLATGAVDDGWLLSFGDPQVETLAGEALEHNLNLQIAARGLDAVEAVTRQSRRALEPVASLALGGASSGAINDDPTVNVAGAGLNFAWEVDVWGRIRAGQSAQLADFQAAQADFEYARQSLVAGVARAWFLVTETYQLLDYSQAIVDDFQEIYDLTENRFTEGIATESDLALARADVATAEDARAQAESAHLQALRAMELLLGRYPAGDVEAQPEFVAVPPDIPAGLPSELLERRPDIVAAERRVAAAFARVDEAKAARLPSLSLTGSLQDASGSLRDVVNPADAAWNLALGLVVPLLDQGGRELAVELATIEQETAVTQYASAALNAFNEVEGALTEERILREREALLGIAAEANREALRLARLQYDEGAIDLLTVLLIQARTQTAEMSLIRTRSARLNQRVLTHLALGGSFELPAEEN